MNNKLVKRYIAYPLAITVFKQDIEKFNQFRLGNLYEDMLESIIERMTKDYFNLKDELLFKYHINIKKIDKGKYQVNKEVMEFTSEELKKLTTQLMSEYLHGDNAAGFERINRTWNN